MSTISKELLNSMKAFGVFDFLFATVACQRDNPYRLSPIPPTLCTIDNKVDTAALARVCDRYDRKKAMELIDTAKSDGDLLDAFGDELYSTLAYVVLKSPLALTHVTLSQGKTSLDMYRVEHSSATEKSFVVPGQKPTYLYHGSPITNWYSIMRNGIRVMSGTSGMTTGAVYGDGIYLSSMLSRSYGFCRPEKGAFVVGIYEIYGASQYVAKGAPADIYVVPKDDLLLLRYMVWVKGGSGSIDSLGDALNALLDKNASRRATATASEHKRTSARIAKELAMLQADYDMKECDTRPGVYTARHRDSGKTYTVDMSGKFPFDAPGITDEKGGAVCGWESNLWNVRLNVHLMLETLRRGSA